MLSLHDLEEASVCRLVVLVCGFGVPLSGISVWRRCVFEYCVRLRCVLYQCAASVRR